MNRTALLCVSLVLGLSAFSAQASAAGDAAAGKPPHLVVVTAEQEYDAKETLPAFFKSDEVRKALPAGAKVTFLNSDSTTNIDGLEALDDADLLVLFVRRRTLPDAQLAKFKAYLERGKPLVALRTSCHAFETWKTFDRDVLGCNYAGHHGKDLKIDVRPAPGAKDSPLLAGVKPYVSGSSLYKVTPLAGGATPLLVGQVEGAAEQPVAWTTAYHTGRVFFTTLGHQDDFKSPEFRRLLLNGVTWALASDSKSK
jgi:type 1 glutamine amidotransferase